ncbi:MULTISPECIES: hypothetical protein [Priestia]|jgi:hypothetical protein|uniref:Uncharacterized protein n=5 Tax=Priestia TaxID=2800373 RepID=D5DQD0_PRIM1|nr:MULTISPECIES: hypothetical protein [Priestia]AVX08082.1 hypothetical protein CS527_10360 [Bacillus sp. Y-01]KOP74255.1 hypothetical protein AMS61_07910 [Bacillus sp. FJAT-21351]KQU19477.1 hypothetical protein ASG61_26535 [Bacillus sp. Leaf75]KRF55537.1 hypothetical protein ASG98_00455 [Bacillus sp. Soil531]MBK0006452.1 hypothetical protein [Bacillus sp. S35]MBK0291930.1 hypothetical protein [Bacillus sp. S34]MBU8853207.1 hypothetical protein [Bacillus sp. FJAT-26377]MBZ5480802.1 hypothet
MRRADQKIILPYTPENLRMLLLQVCDGENPFSHQDLAYWCDKYTLHYYEYEADETQWMNDMQQTDNRQDLAKSYAIAKDIGWQWYFYMARGTTLSDIQYVELHELELPRHLFVKWLNELYEM